ncbi:hypothetical protein ACWGMA_00905 [Streptomyces asiaticus]
MLSRGATLAQRGGELFRLGQLGPQVRHPLQRCFLVAAQAVQQSLPLTGRQLGAGVETVCGLQ